MASMKSWISPDLLSHEILLYFRSNFLFICSNILFLQQPLKQLQKVFYYAVSFVSKKKYLNLQQLFNLQQLIKIAATFKIAAEINRNCSNF